MLSLPMCPRITRAYGVTMDYPIERARRRHKRRYRGTSGDADDDYDPKRIVSQLSDAILRDLAPLLLLSSSRIPASLPMEDTYMKRQCVSVMSPDQQRALHDFAMQTLPSRHPRDWFTSTGLARMAPNAQNAWFYSFETLYTQAFKNWINALCIRLEANGACVAYVCPIDKSRFATRQSERKTRQKYVQPIVLPQVPLVPNAQAPQAYGIKGAQVYGTGGAFGTLAIPPLGKCVKCNRSGHLFYFHMCSSGVHTHYYADRCLRCKVLQWVLEGTFQTRLKGVAHMPPVMTTDATFHGIGQCTETKCTKRTRVAKGTHVTKGTCVTFQLHDLVCVLNHVE